MIATSMEKMVEDILTRMQRVSEEIWLPHQGMIQYILKLPFLPCVFVSFLAEICGHMDGYMEGHD